jgi:cell volume regulation protein A
LDQVATFLIAAAILFVGFLANVVFRKTGWPEILFLILIGIVIGPILGLFPKEAFLPALPLISTLTLLMVLFRGGLDLKISEVLSGSARGLLQAAAYFFLGMIVIAVFLHFLMNWDWISSLMLGSILSQTGEVVIIPLAKRIRLKPQSVILLSLEAVMTSIFNIVFFYAFLQAQTLGTFDLQGTAIRITANFGVGIIVGALMGLAWIRALIFLGKQELAYMITIGYVFLVYGVSESLTGSGPLAVLAFGLVLGNEGRFLRLLRMDAAASSFSELRSYLTHFQVEIAFILRAFFFVLLGLFFELSMESLSALLIFGLPIIGILLVSRYIVVSASTWRSPMAEDKYPIMAMCALGMTPVLLSFIALQSNLPAASLFILIVTNVVIITNIITSVAALLRAKTEVPGENPTAEKKS